MGQPPLRTDEMNRWEDIDAVTDAAVADSADAYADSDAVADADADTLTPSSRPGVTHFGVYHRPSDGHFFILPIILYFVVFCFLQRLKLNHLVSEYLREKTTSPSPSTRSSPPSRKISMRYLIERFKLPIILLFIQKLIENVVFSLWLGLHGNSTHMHLQIFKIILRIHQIFGWVWFDMIRMKYHKKNIRPDNPRTIGYQPVEDQSG